MPPFPREELDEMVERWLEANRRAEDDRDWRPLAEMYTEDATYGWNYGPNQEFMAVGRDQIRDFALTAEMAGLDGWNYPYQEFVVDDRTGSVVGFWKQLADATRADGTRYEVAGIGGSWFRYAGGFQWCWQRDWFDLGNAAAVFMEMMTDGTLSEGMTKRLHGDAEMPGRYPIGQAPAGLWEQP
jgi:hypothetical protein